ERRLMYVAITRARQRLYLSHSQTRMLHGQTRYNLKSRFIDELPEAALKWLTPKNGAFGDFGTSYSRGAGSGGGSGRYGSGSWGGGGGGGRSSGASESYGSGPVPVQKAAPAHGLRIKQKVFHNKFGEGTVTALEG